MTQMRRSRVWRSLLYVPANNEKFVRKALSRGADAIILDLEDSIPQQEKEDARTQCAAALDELIGKGTDIVVRINAPLRLAIRDLESVVRPGLAAILVPKVESAGCLRALDETVSDLEMERGMAETSIGFIPMLETPGALLCARDIAAASKRNIAMMLGGEDFATACGMSPSAETLYLPKLQVAMAAKAEGLLALGMLDTLADISDPEKTLAIAQRSSTFGFDGATCVHPKMVPLMNEAFSPEPDEIALARRTVELMEEAFERGAGAAVLDGRMIDKPIYERALKVLGKTGFGG